MMIILQEADVVKVVKTFYAHYAVVLGPGQVLEFTGDRAKESSSARVRFSTFAAFADGHQVQLALRPTPEQSRDLWRRVFEVEGRRDYSLFSNNCEHIARYVATGVKQSTQVQAAVVVVGLLALVKLSQSEGSGAE